MIEEADEEGYKYLRILERDDIRQEKMKEKVQTSQGSAKI